MLKKIIITFLIVVSLFVPLTSNVSAESDWWNPSYSDFATKISKDTSPADEIFGERYTHAQVSWIIHSLINILGGPISRCSARGGDVVACVQAELTAGNGLGPILATAAYIDQFREKPISGTDYIALKLQDMHLVSEAQAQGFGFSNSLQPIQKLWSLSRNAAYALSTLVMVVLAFMIMFRTKLTPQTSISIQSAIPRIVFALIFITFSYAIAGLLVDLTFVLQGLIAALVSGTLVGDQPIDVFRQMNDVVGNILAYGIAFLFESFAGEGIISKAINLGAFDSLEDLTFVMPALDVVLGIIILLILLILLVRIFWLLVLTYVRFIFKVIIAPFIGLFSVVSVQFSFSGWIKSLVAELAVFATVSILALLAHVFFWGFGNGDAMLLGLAQTLGMQIDPFGANTVENIASGTSGVFPAGFSFGNNTQGLGFFISLVLMLSVPKIANSIRDFISTGKATFGSGIGEATGPVRTLGAMGGDAYMTYGRPGQHLAGLESALKAQAPGTAGYVDAARRLSIAQGRQQFIKNALRGKF